MAGSNPNHSSKRDPAVFVGGQRRRLVRRSNLPRSITTPELHPDLALTSLVSNVGGVPTCSDVGATREEGSGGATSQGPSSTMNFYPPTGGIPADFRPSSKSRPSNSSNTSIRSADSPTLTAASEGKKKHGLFDGLKPKDRDRPDSSQESPIPTSPLPPVTPCKAAQVLGLGPDTPSVGSPRGSDSQYAGVYDGPPVRPVLQKQSSMPLLTKFKDAATSKQTKFREEDVEPDPPKPKKYPWGSGNKKAMKMLDLIPSLGSSSRRAGGEAHAAASPSPHRSEEETEYGYSSDADIPARRVLIPAAPRPAPQRRLRKKGRKSLDRMSPITETSHDEHGTAYRNSDTELDVISEYEHDYPPYSAPLPPRSHTESMLTTTIRYELEEDDLSPTEAAIEEEEEVEVEVEDYTIHPGIQIDTNRVQRQPLAVVHRRGPLQTVENHLLDVAERDLAAQKVALNKLDAARLEMDTETATLKASHERMKKDFRAFKQYDIAHDDPNHLHQHHIDVEDSEDDEDLVSLRSSIDLDEEPTVHVAKVMTFTRITPGMVKAVDIPPRKKPNSPVAPIASAESKPREGKPAFFYEHNEEISPFNERSENIKARTTFMSSEEPY